MPPQSSTGSVEEVYRQYPPSVGYDMPLLDLFMRELNADNRGYSAKL